MVDTQPSSLAGIVTAFAAVITALALVLAALPALIRVLRSTRANTQAIKEVHTIVNQQHTDIMRFNSALIRALQKAGVDVPEDQSLANPSPVEPPQRPTP